MADLKPRGDGDNSMPIKRWPCPGARGGAPRGPCDMAKARLPNTPISRRRKPSSAGKAPVTGATSCAGILVLSAQPLERGAMPSEGIQGDEWGAYVTLLRTTRTNAGSPVGREPYGDGVLIVLVGVTAHRGGRYATSRVLGGLDVEAHAQRCSARPV